MQTFQVIYVVWFFQWGRGREYSKMPPPLHSSRSPNAPQSGIWCGEVWLCVTSCALLQSYLCSGLSAGKFELQVISGCGHVVQEDVPDKVSEQCTETYAHTHTM